MSDERAQYHTKNTTFITLNPPPYQPGDSGKIIFLRTILFLILTGITFIGSFTILAFIPWDCGFSLFDIFIPFRILFPAIISLSIVGFVFEIYVSQRIDIHDLRNRLKRSWLFCMYLDRHLQEKIAAESPYLDSCNGFDQYSKDLAMRTILRHLSLLNYWKSDTKNDLPGALGELGDYEKAYQMLRYLDDLITEYLPKELREKHPGEAYCIRFELIRHVFETYLSRQFPRYQYESRSQCFTVNCSESSIHDCACHWKYVKHVIDFYKMILNIFYRDYLGYEEQPHAYDPELLVKSFDDVWSEYEYEMTLYDIEKEIEYYEEEIKAIEGYIADSRLEIHDLEIILSSFLSEYNARVGILYVKIDRIKLKIKQFQRRIKLAKDTILSEEEAQEIEEEVEAQFSQEYQRLNDIEDETAESSNDYSDMECKKEDMYDNEFLDQLKRLFRKLAMKFHPDMAENEKQKREFHNIFIKIKDAYERRDIERLRKYMKRIEETRQEKDETVGEKLERLKREYKRLEAIYDELNTKLEAMKESKLNRLKKRVEAERSEDRDLLQELADAAEEEIKLKQAELDELIQQYEKLIAQAV